MVEYAENECSCPVCIDMCKKYRPCWGTPEELARIKEAGFGKKLMLILYPDKQPGIPVQILSPALENYEDKFAPTYPYGRCTFLNNQNLCELHSLGLKPLEGRVASCKDEKSDKIVPYIIQTWHTTLGEELVKQWHNKI